MRQGTIPSLRAAPPEPVMHRTDFLLGAGFALVMVAVSVLFVCAIIKLRKRKRERSYPRLAYSRARDERKTA